MCARAKARKNGSAQTHRPGRGRAGGRDAGRRGARGGMAVWPEARPELFTRRGGEEGVRPPGASESRGLRLCSCAVPALGHRHTRPGPGRDAGVRAAGCGVRGAGCARWALYAGRGWARQGSSRRCPGSHRTAQLGAASLGLPRGARPHRSQEEGG
jgi:hypothetical protein